MNDGEFLAFFSKRNAVIDSYFDVFANGSMLHYKEIVQWGDKKGGQTYYQHALNGVMVLERLRDPLLGLELTDPEVRCLFAAYTIHDINKIPPYSARGRKYVDLATEENAARELERLHIADFFPEWKEYLPDIVALMHLHQGHMAVTMTGANRNVASRFTLGWERLKQLGYLMQAADAIDLSHALAMDKHKQDFLYALNAAVEHGQRRFVSHQLAERRGVLTNLLHNAVVGAMREKGAIDLLYYADGVCYLVPVDTSLRWGAEELQETTRQVERRLAEIQGAALKDFIKGSNTGIQVDNAALDSGAGFATILARIRSVVEGGGGTYSAKSATKREADVRANDLAQATDPLLHERVEALLAEKAILPTTEAAMQRAYLIDAYRNLLARHFEAALKRRREDAWTHVYDLVGAGAEARPLYQAISSGRRAYFLIRDVAADFEALYEAMQHDLTGLAGEPASPQRVFVEDYLHTHLNVQGAQPGQPRDFVVPLRRYVADQHRQCCYCGNATPAADWMSANVPPSVNVQLFSARLEGGSSAEPKRMVCAVCRMQFILEKLAWRAHRDKRGEEQITYYLHLFPRTFLTEPLLQAWYGGLERLHAEETTGSFFLDTLAFFRRREERATNAATDWRIPVTSHKINGIALPKLHEAMGNVVILALNAPGETADGQFLFMLEKTLVLQQFFPSRVLVTRSPVPPMVPDGETALIFDQLPASMRWLIPKPVLRDEDVEALLTRLTELHTVGRRLYQRNKNDAPVLNLIRAAGDDPLRLYYVADRMIERKVSGPDAERLATWLSQAVAPHLRALAGE